MVQESGISVPNTDTQPGKASEYIPGPTAQADKNHKLHTSDDVYAREGARVFTGVIVGWIDSNDPKTPQSYLVAIGDAKVVPFPADKVELNGPRFKHPDD